MGFPITLPSKTSPWSAVDFREPPPPARLETDTTEQLDGGLYPQLFKTLSKLPFKSFQEFRFQDLSTWKKFKICFFLSPTSCHAWVDCQICSCAENAYNKDLSDMELKLNLAQYYRMCCVLRSSLKVDQIWRTCFTCSGYWIHSGSKNSCPNLITTLLYFKVSVVDIGVRIKHTFQYCTRVLLSVDRLAWLSNRYLHIITPCVLLLKTGTTNSCFIQIDRGYPWSEVYMK